jgi:poly(A)-specific ribonuclease
MNLSSSNDTKTPQSGFTPSDPSADWKKSGDASLGPRNPYDAIPYEDFAASGNSSGYTAPNETLPGGDGMPRFGTEFWRIYGNKLRVFGTSEGLFDLDPPGVTNATGEADVEREGQGDATTHTENVKQDLDVVEGPEAEDGGVAV